MIGSKRNDWGGKSFFWYMKMTFMVYRGIKISDRYCTCHLSRRHVKFLWGVWGAAPIARSANPRRRRPMEFPTPAVRTRWGADGWLADAAGPATRSLLTSRAPPTDASMACTERRLERCAAMLRPRSRAVCGNAAQRRRHLLAAGRAEAPQSSRVGVAVVQAD